MKKPITKRWWFWVIIVIVAIIIFSSLGDDDSVEPADTQAVVNDSTPEPTTEPTAEPTEMILAFGDTIEVGNFNVVFEKYEIVPVDNQFADFDEGLIITTAITNTSDETQSLISVRINVFTPQGTEGESASHYFTDNYSPYLLDDLRSDSTYINHQIINYVGDGEYIIEIGTLLGDPVEIFFNVTK